MSKKKTPTPTRIRIRLPQPAKKLEPRQDVLTIALDLTSNSRRKLYGRASTNLQCLADLKAIYKKYAAGKYHETHDEAIFMVLAKLARLACGEVGHKDNYVDLAADIAIAYECQQEFLEA